MSKKVARTVLLIKTEKPYGVATSNANINDSNNLCSVEVLARATAPTKVFWSVEIRTVMPGMALVFYFRVVVRVRQA